MELSKYKKLHKIYSKLPLPKKVWDTPEYKAYQQAFHDDKQCQTWELIQRTKEAGINYKKFCCIDMAYHLIEDIQAKKLPEINYDCVITYAKSQKSYGLPIHDGGSSFIRIKYCPWCGTKLL